MTKIPHLYLWQERQFAYQEHSWKKQTPTMDPDVVDEEISKFFAM